MSVEVVVVNPASKMEKDEEELSEEQIQSLLLEAEKRLKKASGSSSKQDGDDGAVSLATGQEVGGSASRPKCVLSAPQIFFFFYLILYFHTDIPCRVPSLNHKQAVQPYVRQSNSIATIDKSRLVPESAKKLAETIHTVEQPLVKVSP